jgi:hypothetical protein
MSRLLSPGIDRRLDEPQNCVDRVEKRKISCPCQQTNNSQQATAVSSQTHYGTRSMKKITIPESNKCFNRLFHTKFVFISFSLLKLYQSDKENTALDY